MKILKASRIYILFIAVLLLSIACSKEDGDLNLKDIDKDCGITIGEDYIAIEAEATNSSLGDWQVVKSGDDRYRVQDAVAPINGTQLEFTGANSYQNPVSPLQYAFTAPKTVTYRLAMRLYQRLEGEEDDKCNDVYIKMEGDFDSGNSSYTTEDLKGELKFFGRGVDQWGCSYNGDGGSNHAKAAVLYNLKEGKTYTFTMSGRSTRTNIDYILFFDNSLGLKVQAHKDLAEHNDVKFQPNWSCSQ